MVELIIADYKKLIQQCRCTDQLEENEYHRGILITSTEDLIMEKNHPPKHSTLPANSALGQLIAQSFSSLDILSI